MRLNEMNEALKKTHGLLFASIKSVPQPRHRRILRLVTAQKLKNRFESQVVLVPISIV